MSMSVTEALHTRISTRDFLADPVPESVVRDILDGVQKKREEQRAKDLADTKADLAAYEKEIAPREAKLDAEQKERTEKAEAELKRFNEQDFPKRMAEFEKKQDLKVDWKSVVTKNLKATGDLKLVQQEDQSIVVTEGKDVRSVYTLTVEPTENVITALRLEAITDKRFPKNGPGRAKDGNFVLNIGPMGDGSIRSEEQALVRDIGESPERTGV